MPQGFRTQAGGLVAAACFGAGSASLGIPPEVGVPLLVVGGSVTTWVVFKLFREAEGRRAVQRLITTAFSRLSWFETGGPTLDEVWYFLDRECEWVRAALGDLEAQLLRDVSQQRDVYKESEYMFADQEVSMTLRAYRSNLSDLSRRLPTLEIESAFKPAEWEDRLLTYKAPSGVDGA